MTIELKPEQVGLILQIIDQASFQGQHVEMIAELKAALKLPLAQQPQLKAVNDE